MANPAMVASEADMDREAAPFSSFTVLTELEGEGEEEEPVVSLDSDPAAVALGSIVMVEVMELVVMVVVAGLPLAVPRQDWYMSALV